ncbi:MAG: hypothetical protein ACTSQI_21065, partial [Candidatus Helarchaeota archaeon]
LMADDWARFVCKPCIKALNERNCDACNWYAKPRPRPTYNPPEKGEDVRLYKINFRYPKKYFKPCKIALIKLKFNSVIEYFKNIGDLEHPQVSKPYIKTIFDKIEEALQAEANIIVCPEFSVPTKELVDKIYSKLTIDTEENGIPNRKGNDKNWGNKYPHNFVLILGSHYEKQKKYIFNQTRVIFSIFPHPNSMNKMIRQYNVVKCALSDLELPTKNPNKIKKILDKNEQTSLKQAEIKKFMRNPGIYRGNGITIFENTPFGDIGILICRDFSNASIQKKIAGNIDLLIIPAANDSVDFKDELQTHVKRNGYFAACNNNLSFDEKLNEESRMTGFYGPIVSREKVVSSPRGEKNKWGLFIEDYNEKNDILYLNVDLLELNRARGKDGMDSQFNTKWKYTDMREISLRHSEK